MPKIEKKEKVSSDEGKARASVKKILSGEGASEQKEAYQPVTFEINLSSGTGETFGGRPGRIVTPSGGSIEEFKEALDMLDERSTFYIELVEGTQEEADAEAQALKKRLEDPEWQLEIIKAAEEAQRLKDKKDELFSEIPKH